MGLLLLACTGSTTDDARGAERPSAFQPLEGIFEPSGIAQLADGQLVVIEDEPSRPFSLLRPASEHETFRAQILPPANRWLAATHSIDDLEALTVGEDGFLLAITSHSRKANGKRHIAREQLVRFRVADSRLTEMDVALGLREALSQVHPVFTEAARERKVKRDGGLNIEGLAYDHHKHWLWLGFRGPLNNGKALLLPILNPNDLFDRGTEFRFATRPTELDLDGGGVRDLAFVPRLGGLLILSQREDGKKRRKFKLWLWSGDSEAPARRVRIDGVEDLERAEGIAPIHWFGEDRLLLLSDDGNRARHQPARYLLIDYDALTVEGASPSAQGATP